MSKTVGDIAINVTADIGPLTMAMKQGAASVEDMERRTKAVGARMQRFGNIAARAGKRMSVVTGAMAAGAAAAFSLAKGTADSGREIKNLSRIAGASTDDFQRWAAASATVGIEQDKLADILKDVNDKVGDFLETGGGPMADFFENIAPKVGVTADQFKNLSGPDALQLYASSLQKANLSQSQMTFYMEAIASDASALSPLLAKNGAEMERLGQAAADAGGIMSGEAIQASGAFSEQMDKLKFATQGLKDQLGAALLPVALALVTALNEKVVPAIASMIEKVQGAISWFQTLPDVVQEAAGVFATVFAAAGPIMVGIGLVSKALGALIAATGPVGLFIAAATLAYVAWQKWGDDIKAAVGPAIDWISGKFQAFLDKLQAIIELAVKVKNAIKDAFTMGQAGPQGVDMSQFKGTGAAISDGITQGLGEGVAKNNAEIQGYLNSITDTANEAFDINSPSKVFAQIGDYIGQGLAQGISDSQGLVKTAVNTLGGGAVDGAKGTTEGVLNSMQQMFTGSKKIAAGMALANSWLAFTEVLKDPSFIGRPWARIGAAFATLAPGLEAVRNIKSASSGGGTGSTSASSTATGSQSSQQRSTSEFNITGTNITGGAALVDALNEALDQGRTINLNYAGA